MLVVERLEEFDFLSEEYAGLFARSSATLFQHPTWLHHLYSSLAPAKAALPVVITVRDGCDRLVGVIPLLRRRHGPSRTIEFADLGVSDYAAPVIDQSWSYELAHDPRLAERIWDAIGPTDLLRIQKIRSTPHEMAALFGVTDCVRQPFDAHGIPLPSSFSEWREERDPAFIRRLKEKRKRIGRNKRVLEHRVLTAPDEIDRAFDQMRSFREARFADRRAIDLMQDPVYDEFYRKVARDGAVGRGPGSTTILTIDNETVGVTFGLSNSDGDLFVLIGYDFTKWRNYSLGLVFVEQLIAVSIDHGRRIHDLTIGHEDYKADFGTVSTPMYAARRARTPTGWIAIRAIDQNRAARRVAKRAVSLHHQHLKGRNPRDLFRSPSHQRS